MSDEWQGTHVLACQVNGNTLLRVQLKDRLSIDEKYLGRGIYIAFPLGESKDWYLFPHDEVYRYFIDNGGIAKGFSSGSIPKFCEDYMANFKIPK
jgi:hypothetical protein